MRSMIATPSIMERVALSLRTTVNAPTAGALAWLGAQGVYGRYWHKADISHDAAGCLLSGGKRTCRGRFADFRF